VRQCGDDGCGASCGTCGNGLYCDDAYRCRAGTPPDPGTVEDIATSDRGTGDAPANVDSPGTDRATDKDASTCPAGYTQYYGQCIPPAESKSGGGCSAGSAPSPAGAFALLTVLAILGAARRRRIRGCPGR
jgi:MYXO-CTERM domain-containing protein